MNTISKRQRIFVKPVDARIIFARGRGWNAWINFYKENLSRASRSRGEFLCRCNGSNVYDAKTGIVLA